MPITENYAKDLLRQLKGRTERLLVDEKYWDVTLLKVFLDHCDETLFDNPKAGLELAELGPKVAALIPERRPHVWQHLTDEFEKRLHRELSARSHSILGGAYRACGMLAAAERSLQTAWQVCESGPVDVVVRANLYKRHARLRTSQQQYPEALDMVAKAIEIYRTRDRDYFAAAILMRGYVLGESGRHAEAVPFFAEALSLSRPVRRSSRLVKRTFQSAVHNLASAVSRGCGPDAAIDALRYVKEAKRFFVKKPSSINKHKLSWVEGRIVAKLGSTRLAERRFLGTFKAFVKLGAAYEAGMVGLDLALIYRRHGQWVELEEVAIETHNRFRELSDDVEALAALKLCLDAAGMRALTESKIVKLRDRMERRLLGR